VPVEQLQHAGRLAERAHALLELGLVLLEIGLVDRIDEPGAAGDGERVRRPL